MIYVVTLEVEVFAADGMAAEEFAEYLRDTVERVPSVRVCDVAEVEET